LEVPVRTLNLLNRRIRVRTYGGVRGAEGQLAFPSTRLLYFLINNRNLILKAATSLPCLFTYKK
ncbi:hypothetical protein, partial [Enterococcus faecium]|uniref:hypothetical protein n=1 Tax=Enterococcus faecium TaxID=1352 RepID=UPI003F766660